MPDRSCPWWAVKLDYYKYITYNKVPIRNCGNCRWYDNSPYKCCCHPFIEQLRRTN